jgi:hypothetical protein
MASLAPRRYPIPYPITQAITVQPEKMSQKKTMCIIPQAAAAPRTFGRGASLRTFRGSSPNRLPDALLLREQCHIVLEFCQRADRAFLRPPSNRRRSTCPTFPWLCRRAASSFLHLVCLYLRPPFHGQSQCCNRTKAFEVPASLSKARDRNCHPALVVGSSDGGISATYQRRRGRECAVGQHSLLYTASPAPVHSGPIQ